MRRLLTLTLLATTVAVGAPTGATAASPNGRGYELVSPAEKNGTGVQNLFRVSADGHGVAWTSLGAYAGALGANADLSYAARETPAGWVTTAFAPRPGPGANPDLSANLGGALFSSGMDQMAFVSAGAFDPGDTDAQGVFGGSDVYVVRSGARVTWISHGEGGLGNEPSAAATLVGATNDGGAIFFTSAERLTPDTPAVVPAHPFLYRWHAGTVEPVGRGLDGSVLPQGAWLGADTSLVYPSAGQGGDVSDSAAVSADGERSVFGAYGQDGSSPPQVYLSTEDAPVRQLSLSQRAGHVGEQCSSGVTVGQGSLVTGASFLAAADDLRYVFFVCGDQLTDDAPVGGGDYVYDTHTDGLAFSNPDDSIIDPYAIASIVKVSADASRVFFVSTHDLAAGAAPGTPNLYVRDQDGVRFISRIAATDSRIAARSYNTTAPNPSYTSAWLSGDGGSLVFQTTAGPDGSGTTQIYRYDVAARALTCLSCGVISGAELQSATLYPPSEYDIRTPRAMTEDGSRVFFTTDSRLDPADVNGVSDVYEYHDGTTTLISDGESQYPSYFAGASPDGVNLFFATNATMSPRDIDGGFMDIYNARLGGSGDAAVAVPKPPCEGDGCQGPPSAPSGQTIAASVSFVGSGETPVMPRVSSTAGKATVAHAKTVTGTSAVLSVRVSARGKLTLSGAGLKRASRNATKAGSYRLTVVLTSRGKAILKQRHVLKTSAKVVFALSSGKSSTATVKLTFRARSTQKGR